MVSTKFVGRTLVGVCITGLLVAIPAPSQAQSSSFVVLFDRSGLPGTTIVEIRDPLTGEITPTVVETGAFENPCTLEFVDVLGSSTITSLQTVDKFGTMKINVGVTTKGTGTGWVKDVAGARVDTGSNYSYSDSQQFSFRIPSTGEEFSSDFTDRLSMRGAKSVDNWTVRAHFKIRISAAGDVQVSLIKMTGDTCKG